MLGASQAGVRPETECQHPRSKTAVCGYWMFDRWAYNMGTATPKRALMNPQGPFNERTSTTTHITMLPSGLPM